MAAILNSLRVYNAFYLLVDSDPSLGLGTPAGVNSLAITPTGLVFRKTGNADIDWTLEVNPSSVPFEYRVGPGLPFATIQSAINQAALDGVGPGQAGIVVISPGTYTENLTLIPNITLQAINQELAINQTIIVGQHTFTQNASPVDFFDYQINFRGLSFSDPNIGDLFTVDGIGETLVIIFGCQFNKGGASGRTIRVTNPNSILAASQCNFFSSTNDFVLEVASSVATLDLNSYNQGASGGFLQFSGAFSLSMANNQINVDAPLLIDILTGIANLRTNFVASFLANASCIQIAAGAQLFGSNNTLLCPPGTGFPYAGNGNVSAGNTVYGGGNSTIDPNITYTQFPVDPKVSRLIAGSVVLNQFDENIIFDDSSTGSFNLTLPIGQSGQVLSFGASSANTSNWTLVTSGGNLIDPAVPATLSGPYRLCFVGNTWYQIG